jgi:hypothetical protein
MIAILRPFASLDRHLNVGNTGVVLEAECGIVSAFMIRYRLSDESGLA